MLFWLCPLSDIVSTSVDNKGALEWVNSKELSLFQIFELIYVYIILLGIYKRAECYRIVTIPCSDIHQLCISRLHILARTNKGG